MALQLYLCVQPLADGVTPIANLALYLPGEGPKEQTDETNEQTTPKSESEVRFEQLVTAYCCISTSISIMCTRVRLQICTSTTPDAASAHRCAIMPRCWMLPFPWLCICQRKRLAFLRFGLHVKLSRAVFSPA